MRAAGTRFVNVTPTRDDLDIGGAFDWMPIRPNTDTAMMLALAHTLHAEGQHDRDFLARYTVGFDRFAAYLLAPAAAVEASEQPYFSLLLIRQGWPAVLP